GKVGTGQVVSVGDAELYGARPGCSLVRGRKVHCIRVTVEPGVVSLRVLTLKDAGVLHVLVGSCQEEYSVGTAIDEAPRISFVGKCRCDGAVARSGKNSCPVQPVIGLRPDAKRHGTANAWRTVRRYLG